MTKEVKIVFLAALTLVMYATSIFLKDGGSFVFPFPLNPFVFFVVAAQIAFWNKQFKAIATLTFATGLFGILASEVFWEIVLSVDQQINFYDQPWFYWCGLLNALGLLAMVGLQIKSQKDLIIRLLTAFGGISLGIGQLFGIEIYTLFGLIVLVFTSYFKPISFPIVYLWTLFLFLECTRWATIMLA